jgi:TIR domain
MIFVSYSRSDIRATRIVVETLSAQGVECWLDESNIPVGQAFVERLGLAMRKADCFLLVDTAASRSSYWVSRELQTSSRYRKDGRYHSIVRVYSPNCRHNDAAAWDVSVPLNRSKLNQIVEFLASRNRARLLPEFDDEFPSVSILNDTGLGQPENWTGRQDELRALDNWWFKSFPGAWLYGSAGSGKSGLLQTWITALSYLGYGELVSANVLYLRGREVDLIEAQRTLNTWRPMRATTLLLFVVDGHDEARSTPDVEEALAQAVHLGVRALVTSRTAVPRALSTHFMNLQLGGLTRRDSVAILNQFGVTGHEGVALAAELDDHPLALLLFSRSLANEKETAAAALEALRSMRGDMLAGGLDASRSIRTLLRGSVKSLSLEARALLERLCRTAEGAPEPPGLADLAIGELAGAGLVQVDHLSAPSQVSIHPLVRKYINEEQNGTSHGRPGGAA